MKMCLVMILVKKVFIFSKTMIICLLCPLLCGLFFFWKGAKGELSYKVKKELQDLGVTKIPSSNKIQNRIENLESEQAATVREKQELQKKQKTLNIIRQNFTALLNAPEMQIPISEKELTL